jgi:hypothetical protein
MASFDVHIVGVGGSNYFPLNYAVYDFFIHMHTSSSIECGYY